MNIQLVAPGSELLAHRLFELRDRMEGFALSDAVRRYPEDTAWNSSSKPISLWRLTSESIAVLRKFADELEETETESGTQLGSICAYRKGEPILATFLFTDTMVIRVRGDEIQELIATGVRVRDVKGTSYSLYHRGRLPDIEEPSSDA